MTNNDVLIKFEDVHKAFGSQKILTGTNLDIHAGETVVIIGGSGTGKSVMLKHSIGLLKPDQGKVYFKGQDISVMKERDLSKIRVHYGMLFQGAALFDSLTVAENISFPLRDQKEKDVEKINRLVSEKLTMVGLPGIENKYPAELSGGMKKRVGLARAIIMNPEIILYDEPTTGLDPIMSDAINNLIIEMKEKVGGASLVVTHDMVSARKIADRIVMLYKGKIIFDGTPDETFETNNEIVRQFVEGRAEGPITDNM